MQTIKILLGVIIALLATLAIELARIIALLSGPTTSTIDFGIPIIIVVGLGTLVLLASAISTTRTGLKSPDQG